MLNKKIMIQNKLGLHARAAMKLINLTGRYESEIFLHYRNRKVNAKSILGVMALGAARGAEIELIVDGPDETDALSALENLINNFFDETE